MAGQGDRGRAAAPTYYPLVVLICALAAGIVVDRWLSLPAEVWWLLGTGAVVFWLGVWFVRRKQAASWVLMASVLATGGAWHHAYWRLYAADEISRMVQEEARPVCVEAIAITSPRWIPAPTPTPLRTIPQGERSELVIR